MEGRAVVRTIALPPRAALPALALPREVSAQSSQQTRQAPLRAASDPPPRCSPSDLRRAAALGAALVPGILVHGTGHWVLCESKAARKLATYELIGVATTVGSGAGLALTGASQYVVAPLALGALTGLGLFSVTFLADVYGVLAPVVGRGAPGPVPRLSLQTGVRSIYDPHFEYRWLLSHAFRYQRGPYWIAPRLDAALDAHNQRYSLRAGRGLLPRPAGATAPSRTALDLQVGVSDHNYNNEGFATTTLELAFTGRLQLEALAPNLKGSFAEGAAGYAREITRYDGLPTDGNDQLLARFGFGFYLGRPGGLHGESSFVYDHRRDNFAGGLKLPGIGAGYAGHVEHRTELYLAEGIGAAAELTYGSAFIASAYLLMRWGTGMP
jgi:hypothetical protein